MKISFTKMHGLGNDYIYLNCMEGEPKYPDMLALAMSPRRFSVGGDGLVLICRSAVADAKMRMFNADGSEGKMCGNAIRCVGKYLYDNRIVPKEEMTIETLSGIKRLHLNLFAGKVQTVGVDMGQATLAPSAIPVLFDGERMVSEPVEVEGSTYNITAVSVGNPHAVIFLDDVNSLNLEQLGPRFEHLPLFPDRVNTEFVRRIDAATLQMRVWERGSGETFACGTGSCAAVTAAVVNGYCKPGVPVTVQLKGGDLEVTCDENLNLRMFGRAETVYEGVYEYEDPDQ